MKCKISKSKLSGRISCPTNKSYSHRAIFAASLTKGKSRIRNILRSADVNSTIEACKNFGANIKDERSDLIIESTANIKSANINAGNSGTTIRIAAAISGLNNEKTTLTGDESLQKRPMQIILDALEIMEAKCSSQDGKPPITVTGKIVGGEVKIPGNVSSQFISALMLVGPLTEKGITITIERELVSKPYLDATIATMKKFGIKIDILSPYKKYSIHPQTYTPTTFTVPSDLSSLALLLSAAILVGEELLIDIEIGDLPQGDKSFISILESMGVIVSINDSTVTVKSPEKLAGGKFDLGDTPDLLPPLAILALKSDRPIEIFNVKHARFKETDRIKILSRELSKTGIKVIEKDDGMILECPDKITGIDFNSEGDHRLFMAFSIAGLFLGNCSVSNSESVKVSYPNFISDMNKVGGKIDFIT